MTVRYNFLYLCHKINLSIFFPFYKLTLWLDINWVQFDLTLRDVSVFLAINLRKYRNCRLCLQWHVLFYYRVNSVSPGWIWSPEVAKVKQYIHIRIYLQLSQNHWNTVTIRRIPLPWSDGAESNSQGRGTFCPSPMLVFYIRSCQNTFPEFPVKKRKSVSMEGAN